MGFIAKALWVFALGASVMAGCTQVTEESEPNPGIFVRVRDIEGLVPLGGAEICEINTDNCVLTDANGQATLVPLNKRFAYTVTMEGYQSHLYPEVVDTDYPSRPKHDLMSHEVAADYMEAAESQYPMMTMGAVRVYVSVGTEGDIPGATLDLVGATGKRFYEEDDLTPRLDLEATTSLGRGGFVDVPPGEHQIEIGGTATNCAPRAAWHGDEPNRIRLPVQAGRFTLVGVRCSYQP